MIIFEYAIYFVKWNTHPRGAIDKFHVFILTYSSHVVLETQPAIPCPAQE